MILRRLGLFSVFLACCEVACTPTVRQVPVQWTDLRGWPDDDHAAAFTTFLASCAAVERADAKPKQSVPDPDLKAVCRLALARGPLDNELARWFFEENFKPMRLQVSAKEGGLVTGYYVPVFRGSRVPTPELSAPMYARPTAPEAMKLTREEIEKGALEGQSLELFWVDPIDAFFAQVQGSARIRLPDGILMKLEYTAKTEHPYTSVGRVLIDRGLVPKEEMSMQRIRTWMAANPAEAVEVRRQNKSFVFFTATEVPEAGNGLGAQGVPLTPQRSVAVDKNVHAYGTPFFISVDLPMAEGDALTAFNHTVVAMDTGSAIVGAARADIYWGVGDEAAEIAGRSKHRGTFIILVPTPHDAETIAE